MPFIRFISIFLLKYFEKNLIYSILRVGSRLSSSFKCRGRELGEIDRRVPVPIYIKDKGFRDLIHRAPHPFFALIFSQKITGDRRHRRVIGIENADNGFGSYASVVSYVKIHELMNNE